MAVLPLSEAFCLLVEDGKGLGAVRLLALSLRFARIYNETSILKKVLLFARSADSPLCHIEILIGQFNM